MVSGIDLNISSLEAARTLLGCVLVREYRGEKLAGRIVETEAYDQSDAASHTYRGETLRNSTMFGPAGHAYVYFTYGMHYCFNVVTGSVGHGCGVLIRAIEPIEGLDIMYQNRKPASSNTNLTNGPAKLCQALAIDMNFNGHDLSKKPLYLLPGSVPTEEVVQTTRIGITKETTKPWRFYLAGNTFVSKR